MQHKVEENEPIYLIEGPDPDGPGAKMFGITKAKIEAMKQRGGQVKLAQLIMIVSPHLIVASPIFKGAKRPLNYKGDMEGSKDKHFFTIRPKCDYDWVTQADNSLDIVEMPVPRQSVFVTIATPNNCGKFPSVHFWLESWSWVDEDAVKPGFPINWVDRYDEVKKSPPV